MIKDKIFINIEPKQEARSKLHEKISNKTKIKRGPRKKLGMKDLKLR